VGPEYWSSPNLVLAVTTFGLTAAKLVFVTISTQRRAALDAAGIAIAFALIALGLAVQIPVIDLQTLGVGTGLVASVALLLFAVRAARSRRHAGLFNAQGASSNERHISVAAGSSNIAGAAIR
jgi:hypothetical protein